MEEKQKIEFNIVKIGETLNEIGEIIDRMFLEIKHEGEVYYIRVKTKEDIRSDRFDFVSSSNLSSTICKHCNNYPCVCQYRFFYGT